IERELKEDGRTIDGDVSVCRAWQVDGGDRAHTEVGAHEVLDDSAAFLPPRYTDRHLVQEGIVERPAMRVRQRDIEMHCRRATGDTLLYNRAAGAVRECQCEHQVARRRFEQPCVDADATEISLRREM